MQLSPPQIAAVISAQFTNCQPLSDTQSQLHTAAERGDLDTLGKLLDEMAVDPDRLERINLRNHLGHTPLRMAAHGWCNIQ